MLALDECFTAKTVEERQLHQEPAQTHLSSLPYSPYDVIQWFHHSFVVCRVDFLASHFMTPILLQPYHGPVLSLALVSVSVTRFGKVANNPSATQYGHSQYTRCLKLLQSILNSPKLTQDDATLGCAAVLGLFEVSVHNPSPVTTHPAQFLNSDKDTSSLLFQTHLAGIEQLLRYRGPESCQTPISRAILEHCREISVRAQNLVRTASLTLTDDTWANRTEVVSVRPGRMDVFAMDWNSENDATEAL